jgi:transposase
MIGLPSLHALDGAQAARIWLATEATDMRCGFDRLAERVRAVIGEDPQSGHLFVFRSRRGNRPSFCILPQNPGSLRVLFS